MSNSSQDAQTAPKTIRVVQCWDDGVNDDIRVMEILRKYGAKGSFNLNAASHGPQRQSGWKYKDVKEVYRISRPELVSVYEGFLIANHSLAHPHLESIPIADAVREIREGRDQLEQIFGYPVLGFAYPFGTHNEAVRNAVREAGHLYARTTENVADVFPPADPMAFHSNCHFHSPDFWARFEHVKQSGGVFYFWGHSYEIMNEDDWQAFEKKIAILSADPAVVWTDLPELFA
ncbi:MAG: polysaccharide deacetylase family protein [Capsulimonadaceae bacterium]|nr:polysaccharide deacetylase family protein [Capsulimonadaceae bacterium]